MLHTFSTREIIQAVSKQITYFVIKKERVKVFAELGNDVYEWIVKKKK